MISRSIRLRQYIPRYARAFSAEPFSYEKPFPLPNTQETPWRKIPGSEAMVDTVDVDGRTMLKVSTEAITTLTKEGMTDIAHLLRPAHLSQLRSILDDPEASQNDKFVALELLKNANIAAGKILPGCQDTGTAIVMGKRGRDVLTTGSHSDEEAISKGVYDTYTERNLRYSQVAARNMFEEGNTGCNLPAQIDIFSEEGDEYKFMFMAKGGGSANKTFLYQQTKALLNEKSLTEFAIEKIKTIGTSACPPYHLCFVVGGLSAEQCLKTVKLGSAKYLDGLPTTGSQGGRAFRDIEWEEKILKITQEMGIGAQFGGKYFCHDVRVIRLPRHGASCPVGLGVSCSADRQVLGKINKEGVFLEQLEEEPSKYLPEVNEDDANLSEEVVKVDLNQPMSDIRAELSKYPIATRLSLSGTIIVARDIAHAKILERLEKGEEMPKYLQDHIVYYAGPAKTPDGYASGSFGPTTAGRMDSYVGPFMEKGGSFISLAKGNRSKQVRKACKEHGGFYLGSIGGPAAILAQNNIKNVQVEEYEELGMEAVWKIEVTDFPAFIVCNDKGEDFFTKWLG